MSTATLIREIEKAGIRPQELLRFIEEPRPLNPREVMADAAAIFEAGFAARKLGIPGHELAKMIDMAVPIGGGSFLTGTGVELLYSSIATATQLNTFTTEDNLQKTLPYVILPAGFFYNPSAVGKSLKIRAYVRVGTTGAPTMTFTVRLLTSTTWSAAGVAWSTAAITLGTTVTLAPIQIDFDLVARAIAAGATGLTIAGMGLVSGGTALAAGGGTYTMPNANTAFTNTVDHSVTQYVFLSAACGTSNAANLVQLEMLKVYGEN